MIDVKTQIPRQGLSALARRYRGIRSQGRPLLFLDLDDVLCLNDPYGGNHLRLPTSEQPTDLWDRIWHPPSMQVLRTVFEEFAPHLIMTTSWLRFMERDGFVSLFKRTGLPVLGQSFHHAWEAPQGYGTTRLEAIDAWLAVHYEGQPLVILDDVQSGSGLRGSRLEKAGCVVLCDSGVGLSGEHLRCIRSALGQTVCAP